MKRYRVTIGTHETDIFHRDSLEEAEEAADAMASDMSLDTQREWFVVDVEEEEEV